MFTRHYIFALYSLFLIGDLHSQEWIWATQAGGSTVDEAYSIATDQQGNIYLTGYIGPDGITFGNDTLTSRGNLDIFIAKYTADGEALWAKSAGGAGNDYGYSIAVDPTGNICITGSFADDSIHFNTTSLENFGGDDVFVAKYDALGNLLWAKSAGGGGADQAFGITTDAEANIYITGQLTSQSISFDQTTVVNSNTSFQEIFIAKFDAGGNVQWARTAAGTHNDVAYSIVSSPSGDLYITGFFRSLSIGFSQILLLNTAPAREMFVAKFDTKGEVVWAKKAGGEQNDLGYSAHLVSEEVLQVTGSFRSDSIIFGNTVLKNSQSGALDFFLTRYDTSGQVIWAKGGGGQYDDHGFCNVSDFSSASFAAGGYLSKSMIVGSDTLLNTGDSTYEMFIIKFNPDGNLLWSESIGGSGDDYVNWMTRDPSGNLIVSGYFGSPSVTFGSTTLHNNGGDLFIAKLSPITVDVHEIQAHMNPFVVYPNPAHDHFTIGMTTLNSRASFELYSAIGEKLMEREFSGSSLIQDGQGFQAVPGIYFILLFDGNGQWIVKLIIQ